MVVGTLVTLYFTVPAVQQTLNEGFELAKAGDEEALARWFEQFGFWGPVAIILFMVLQLFLIIFPSWLPMIVAVAGYGPVWGVAISVAAVVAASTVGYFIGRFFGPQARDALFDEKQKDHVQRLVEHYSFGIVALFRLSPILSTDAISLVAGLLGMNYWRYIGATLLGITPLAIGIAYFAKDLERLKEGLYWLGGIGLLLYGVYIWLDRRDKRQRAQTKKQKDKE